MPKDSDQGLFRKLAVPIAVVALAAAAFLIIRNLGGSGISGLGEPKWMYNLAEGKLVARGAEVVAPADLDGATFDYGKLGTAGPLVDAYVFTCGDAEAIAEGMTVDDLKAVNARLNYVTRSGPGAADRPAAGPPSDLISDPTGKEWSTRTSPRGIKLATEASATCPDGSRPLRSIPH